jgi:TatD DNase family protein
MFSDTHCHLSYIAERGENLVNVIGTMRERAVPFVLDIGTRPGDLARRAAVISEASGGAVPDFIHFSCGLWPDAETIADRNDALAALKADLDAMLAGGASGAAPAFAGFGECGLDRYWNGAAAAERIAAQKLAGSAGGAVATKAAADDGPGTTDIAGEEDLFLAQLELARAYCLPVIVHSRDAFEPTLGCIADVGYDSGVIHCFSYGVSEARAFLDRGWYISFPGNITWAKKEADKDRIASLVRYVPRDRLLLETDAPYLTPAPHRGKTNTPLFIEHTYNRAAEILGLTPSELALLVAENAKTLFAYPAKK